MSGQIIGLHDWFETPPGRYLLAWEQAQFDQAVADMFGYHALQLGLSEVQGLRANRMPHRWLARFDSASTGRQSAARLGWNAAAGSMPPASVGGRSSVRSISWWP